MAIPKLNFGRTSVVDPTSGAMQGIAQARGALTDMVNQAYAEEEALRKETLARDQMAAAQSNADRTYELAQEKHEMDVADFNTKGLNYGANNLTQTVQEKQQVPGTLTDQQRAELAALKAKRAGLIQPVVETVNNQNEKLPLTQQEIPASVSTVPDNASGTLRGYLLDGEGPPATREISGESILASRYLNAPTSSPEKSTGVVDQVLQGFADAPKNAWNAVQMFNPLTPNPYYGSEESKIQEANDIVAPPDTKKALTEPIKNEPKELDTQLKEIDAQIKKLSSTSPKTVTKDVVKLTKLDPNNINSTLTEQFKERFGREPNKYEISSIGARTKEVYENLYKRQQDAIAADLNRRKIEADIAYKTKAAESLTKDSSKKDKTAAFGTEFDTLKDIKDMDLGSWDEEDAFKIVKQAASGAMFNIGGQNIAIPPALIRNALTTAKYNNWITDNYVDQDKFAGYIAEQLGIPIPGSTEPAGPGNKQYQSLTAKYNMLYDE